jgi:hypothetical protein
MPKHVRKTVLLCCEGKADKAFIAYLRAMYTAGHPGAPHVKPKQAGGKGSNNVIDTLLGEAKCSQPDKLVALYWMVMHHHLQPKDGKQSVKTLNRLF